MINCIKAKRRKGVDKAFEYSEEKIIFAQEKTSAADMAYVIKEIIDERYSGLANAETAPQLNGYISISADRFAHFLKLLLKYAYPDCFFTVSFGIFGYCFSIFFKKSENFVLRHEDAYELMRYAKKAGFIINIEEDKITLSTALREEESSVYSIYARTRCDIRKIFDRVFSKE